ncbi:MAG: helix-turn-helix domain-containing protein [Candidatus Obscuribacterales bacterium]|nr:helix-turn-helix domain-containing protein [Candidatus Obscuribacterales bacterium]
MIKNEKQFKIAKAKLEKWIKNLEVANAPQAGVPEWILKEQKLAVTEQIKQLEVELQEYVDTVAGGIQALPDTHVIDDIPTLLIRWRIARKLSQKQLAEAAGIHENLLQKYEMENYNGASFKTIRHIAHVLRHEVDSPCCVHQPG